MDQTTVTKDLSEITTLEEIERTLITDKTYIRSNWARVGNLEFRNTNGKWKLERAYLEYPTIKKLENE